jgi:hypothetical protein
MIIQPAEVVQKGEELNYFKNYTMRMPGNLWTIALSHARVTDQCGELIANFK